MCSTCLLDQVQLARILFNALRPPLLFATAPLIRATTLRTRVKQDPVLPAVTLGLARANAHWFPAVEPEPEPEASLCSSSF